MNKIIAVSPDGILLDAAGQLPCSGLLNLPAADEIFSFDIDGCQYTAFAIKTPFTDGLAPVELRAARRGLSGADDAAVVKAAELIHWHLDTPHCSRCGGTMRRSDPISKKCPDCGREIFPQMSPAIIVLITRDDSILLARGKNFRGPYYGLIAGFVETGETLEQCVAREVMEETSLTVKNIRYIGSQSWPFPSSLMLAFTAEYAGGEICFADGELVEGDFFVPGNLPMLPPTPSIARALIDRWLAGQM